MSLVIDRWAKLNPNDKHNLSFEQVIRIISLSENHRRLLKSAGATDLRSIAWAIKIAPEIYRYNIEVTELEKIFKVSKDTKAEIDARKIMETVGKPIQFPISPKDSADICDAIGKALQSNIKVKAKKK